MTPLKTAPLTRQQIGQFVGSERGVRAFENVQADIGSQYEALTTASFLTLSDEPQLGSERRLTLTAGQLTGTDGGANEPYTLGLADTAVTAGTYGDAAHTIAVTVDAKGRLTGATVFALSTSNVTEGTGLYFTDARARAAVSAGSGLSYNSATGVFTLASGTVGYTVVTTAVNYTVTATSGYTVVLVSASGKTVTLPTAVGNTAMLSFKLLVAGTLTIQPHGLELIDGGTSAIISTQYGSATIISDNATWWVV